MTLYGVDFGTGDALSVWGPSGHVPKKQLRFPKIKGGRTPAMEFIMVGKALMTGNDNLPAGDIVVESATIGSSGCEVADVVELLHVHPDRVLYTISNRAVKNYRADHKLEWRKGARYAEENSRLIRIDTQPEVHIEDSEIIYRIATEHPERLKRWRGPAARLERVFTSVRPMDKRGYRDDRAERLMAMLPPYSSLPAELRAVLGNGKAYSRSMVMPFAMATEEPHLHDGPREDRRRRYEKILGLYDSGYPSFYRRATIVWMQSVAKHLAEVSRIAEVPKDIRKAAQKLTQRQIRWFFHLTMQHQGR